MKICYTSDLAIFAFTLQNIKYAKIISVIVGYNFLNHKNDWEKLKIYIFTQFSQIGDTRKPQIYGIF